MKNVLHNKQTTQEHAVLERMPMQKLPTLYYYVKKGENFLSNYIIQYSSPYYLTFGYLTFCLIQCSQMFCHPYCQYMDRGLTKHPRHKALDLVEETLPLLEQGDTGALVCFAMAMEARLCYGVGWESPREAKHPTR